ncbi:UNVERIFIED_CONTAM: hypothetical protein Sindi_2843800 [Sesamum indicum]
MHKRKMETELGRPPTEMELLARYYKEKTISAWSRHRVAEDRKVSPRSRTRIPCQSNASGGDDRASNMVGCS